MKKLLVLAISLFSSFSFGRINNTSLLTNTQTHIKKTQTTTIEESTRYITYANELTKGGYSMSVRYVTI